MRFATRDDSDENFIGSPDAAQDLYGLGVRLGLYLQGMGMIFSMVRSRKAGIGVKLATGSICISILVSWTVLASHREFSPCEAYLELFLLSSVLAPGKMVLFNPDSLIGETIGLICLLITELWWEAAGLWLFARLYTTLPTLGTENVTFFFAKVFIGGWFRILMLVLAVLGLPSEVIFAYRVIRALGVAIAVYRRGGTEMTEEERKTAAVYGDDMLPFAETILEGEKASFQRYLEILRRILPILVWIYSVTTVETTISWNRLTPSTDLRSPGQLIPFATGIIVFVDGLLGLLHPSPKSPQTQAPEAPPETSPEMSEPAQETPEPPKRASTMDRILSRRYVRADENES